MSQVYWMIIKMSLSLYLNYLKLMLLSDNYKRKHRVKEKIDYGDGYRQN